MSIARLILRMITKKALEGQTQAEDRVKDSSIADLNAALAEAPKPIILVYTDDSQFVPEGRELTGGQGSQTLVLLISNAGYVAVPRDDPNEPEEKAFVFPVTDANLELSLDLLERQIQIALSDPENPWADLWNKIVTKVGKWSSTRGQGDKKGTRFAARQILIEVETLHDPLPGTEIEAVWREIIDQIIADENPAFAELGEILEAFMVGKPWELPRRHAQELGLPYSSLAGIGLDALEVGPDGKPLPEEIVDIEIIDGGKL